MARFIPLPPYVCALEEAAKHLFAMCEKPPLNLGSYKLFLPSNRSILGLQECFKALQKTLILPQCYAINDIDRLLLEFPLSKYGYIHKKEISSLIKRRVIFKSAEAHTKEHHTIKLQTLTDALLKEMNELLFYALTPSDFASSLEAELHDNLLYRVYKDYDHFLKQHNFYDPFQKKQAVLNALGLCLQQQNHPIEMIGFSQYQVDTFSCFEKLLAHPHTTFMIPFSYENDPLAKEFLEKLTKEKSASLPIRNTSITSKFIIESVSQNAFFESKAVAFHAFNAFQEGHKKIGIVLLDLSFKPRLIEDLKVYNIALNDATGLFFSQTSSGIFLALLGCFLKEKTWKNFFALLKHPKTLSPSWIFEAEKTLRTQPSSFPFSLKNLKEWEGGCEEFSFLCQPLPPKKEEFLEYLENMILALCPSFFEEDENKIVQQLFKELREYIFLFEDMDFLLWLDVLLKEFQSQKLTYSRDPYLFEVQLLGLMETRLETFDLLIIPRAHDGILPRPFHPSFWLLKKVREKLSLPDSERTLYLQKQDFFLSLGTASKVIMTYSKEEENLPSRFFYDLSIQEKMCVDDLILHHDKAQKNLLEEEKKEPLSKISPCPPVEFRPKKISITAFKMLRRNPYAFYARYILKLFPLFEWHEDTVAILQGQLLHRVLDKALKEGLSFKPPHIQNLCRLSEKIFAEESVFLSAMQRYRFTQFYHWLCHHTPPYILKSEVRKEKIIQDITFYGTIDRIDTHPNGMAIIDYKTGSLPSQKTIELGLEPQLPMEAFLLENDEVDLCYISILPKSPFGENIFIKNSKHVITACAQGLSTMLETYLSPSFCFYVNTDPVTALDYDEYQYLARQEVA